MTRNSSTGGSTHYRGWSQHGPGDGMGPKFRWIRRLMFGVFLLLFVLPMVMAAILTAVFAGWTGAAVAAIVGLIVLSAGVLLARFVFRGFRTVNDLVGATTRLADGDYTVRVSTAAPPAFGPIIASFNDMAHRLEDSDELRRRLLADVGHELRTPLTIVRGELEAMADGVRDLNEAEIRRLLVDVAAMERLLDDLRILSTTEAGVLDLHRERVDLVDLVVSAVDRFRPDAERRGTVVTVRAHDREIVGPDGSTTPLSSLEVPELQADVDPHRIGLVVSNLMANALRAVDTGGNVQIRLSQEVIEGDSESVIRVEDDGVGIASDELDAVFDRFHKAADSSGSGLGLTISRGLVEAHGGTIEAVSTEGAGTIMTMRLPTAPPA